MLMTSTIDKSLAKPSINLSISSSGNKSVKISLLETCHLQTRCDLLKQLIVESLWITSFDNQLATDLSSISCHKSYGRIPGIGKMSTDLLQL